jgi:hydroxymethylbilane synthase
LHFYLPVVHLLPTPTATLSDTVESSALKIGSRGSQLALTQANLVRDLLLAHHPSLSVEIVIIQTRGDVTAGSLRAMGGQGLFTAEIERALLDGRIDLAVHSLKDLGTAPDTDLELVASPPREDVRDVLIVPAGGFDDLAPNACLGTDSPRRQAQLRRLRPDLRFASIRGNIDTRLAKVGDGRYDGIVLAAAALHRLGWRDRISAYFEPDQVVPAAGQAALGLQMRRDDERQVLVRALNDAPTFAAVSAERACMRGLGGGCSAPIGTWARWEKDTLVLDALVGSLDGSQILRAAHSQDHSPNSSQDSSDPQALGTEVARQLISQGADRLLASV